ncbi:MAG: serine hydroxymethyltransferase, partial [Candidatus Paceibacterota bacterium]
PHSGAPANIAVYAAWLEPGDTVLGMHLEHGGHLTHGHPVTHMSKYYNFVRYEMKDVTTGEIDYDRMREIARKEKPKIILAGFSAYSRNYDYKIMAEIAEEVGALAVADMAHIAGLIAGGELPNPFDYGFHVITTTTHKTLRGPRGGLILSKGVVGNPLKAPEKTIENIPTLIDRSVFPGLQGGPHMNVTAAKAVAFGEALQPSFKEYAKQIRRNAKAMEAVLRNEGIAMIGGGTDNHLILADVFTSFGIGGKEAEETLDAIGITLNKNAVPFDTRKPFDPSGIRFGTPAMTTRGMKEAEATRLAEIMIEALRSKDDETKKKKLHEEVNALCEKFPIPEAFV